MVIARAVPLLILAAAAGCGRPSGGPSPDAAPRQSGDAVVADVEGEKIALAELDERAAGQLQQLRDQEYELRMKALEDLIGERLLEKRARERGVSPKELTRTEVDLKVPSPTPAEIDAIYDQNRDRVGGRSRDEVAPQIVASLTQQRIAERRAAFLAELRGSANVKILLEQPRTEVKVAEGAQARGPASAPVTIVEYSDYLCPYCQRAEATLSAVLARHEGKVRFVHRDLLIGRPRSMAVARAALCAGEQGKFWEYRTSLLSATGDWSDQDLASRATAIGLAAADFKSCLASDRHEQAVLDSTEEGQRLGVNGTPTFFINGRRMVGVRSEADLDQAIRSELARRG
jgi:protein-disulfide isomerase